MVVADRMSSIDTGAKSTRTARQQLHHPGARTSYAVKMTEMIANSHAVPRASGLVMKRSRLVSPECAGALKARAPASTVHAPSSQAAVVARSAIHTGRGVNAAVAGAGEHVAADKHAVKRCSGAGCSSARVHTCGAIAFVTASPRANGHFLPKLYYSGSVIFLSSSWVERSTHTLRAVTLCGATAAATCCKKRFDFDN